MEVSFTEYLRARGHDVWAIELRGPDGPLQRWLTLLADPKLRFHRLCEIRLTRPPRWPGSANPRNTISLGRPQHGRLVGLRSRDALRERALHIADCHCVARSNGEPAFCASKRLSAPPATEGARFVPAALAGQAGKLAPSIGAFAMNFLLANGKLIEPQYLKRLAPLALSPVSTKLIDQIAGWFDHNRNHPLELGWQWDKLANVTTPVLALAGSVDQLAPEHNVRELLGRVSSTDKNLLVCGKHTGFSADFGHIDIMLSTPARLEIYPRIAQWLESHRDVDGTVERGQQEVVQLHPSNRRTHAGALTDSAG